MLCLEEYGMCHVCLNVIYMPYLDEYGMCYVWMCAMFEWLRYVPCLDEYGMCHVWMNTVCAVFG